MESSTKQGMNRTGLQMSPKDAAVLLEAPERYPPTARGDESALAAARQSYAREADALGSIPPPGTAKGLLKSGLQMLTGNRPQVLIDKIAERLAYERAGVRMYDAYLAKLRAAGESGPVDVATVERIQAEELAHVHLLAEALERLGADPTAQTPCADLVGVQGIGFVQALTEPRTSVAQATETILYVELADNDSWALLAQLARECGQDELAERFAVGLREEEEHLAAVRGWAQRLALESVRMGSTAARLS
jgi:rubrerythrin